MSVAFVKFPLAKVLSISVLVTTATTYPCHVRDLTNDSVLWAITLGCHGAAQNFAGLVVLRIFLGAFESAISPGFSLMTGIWYDALYLAF